MTFLGSKASSRGVDSGTETQQPPPVEIKFSSNLTYAERLLLKKHRRTDVEEMDTPRVEMPPTPRLPAPLSPRDAYQGVEMPVTPRDTATPRIEAYPRREAGLVQDEEDFDDGGLYDCVYSNSWCTVHHDCQT